MEKFEKLVISIMKECEQDGEPVTREEAEEMAKMEMNAPKRYEREDKPKKKVQKARKVDEQKKLLITAIAECLTDSDVDNISVKNESEISFNLHSDCYTLKLIKHRLPKK